MALEILLKEKNQKLLAFISSGLLLIAIAYWAGIIFWQINDQPPDINSQKLLSSIFNQPLKKVKKQEDIASLHLFGIAKYNPVIAKPRATVAPISRLNLTLKGVFSSDPPEDALAIISSGSRDELLYSVNETLPGGAILKEVYNDRVIIDRNGSLETLEMTHDDSGIVEKNEDEREISTEQIFRSSPRELRKEILKNPIQLTKIMATIPAYKNGHLVGYKLKMKKYHGLLEQFGLLETDVVTSINGIATNSPANGFKLLQQLTNAPNLELNVLRNGQKQSLSVSLQ